MGYLARDVASWTLNKRLNKTLLVATADSKSYYVLLSMFKITGNGVIVIIRQDDFIYFYRLFMPKERLV